jgi:hypothetical protein
MYLYSSMLLCSTMTINRPVPVPTPVNTTSKCGEYYLVEPGEDCGIVTNCDSTSMHPSDDNNNVIRYLDPVTGTDRHYQHP